MTWRRLYAAIGLLMFLLMSGAALTKFFAGRHIKQRKSRAFCMVVAALGCPEFPYGMVLGVFTFIVLGRQSVAKRFIAKS